jgi:hypothetical protein
MADTDQSDSQKVELDCSLRSQLETLIYHSYFNEEFAKYLCEQVGLRAAGKRDLQTVSKEIVNMSSYVFGVTRCSLGMAYRTIARLLEISLRQIYAKQI